MPLRLNRTGPPRVLRSALPPTPQTLDPAMDALRALDRAVADAADAAAAGRREARINPPAGLLREGGRVSVTGGEGRAPRAGFPVAARGISPIGGGTGGVGREGPGRRPFPPLTGG